MRKIAFLSMIALSFASGALAQGLDNPAENASLSNGFVRVGEFRSNVRNNVGAASFIFPHEDKLVTGLHSSVSADEFLGGLKPVNSYYSQINYNLVSYGWKGGSGAYHTVEIGTRANYGLSLPKEIFHILKTGTSQSPYDLSSLKAFGNAYGEIAYSYSRQLSDKLAVGGRLKLLAGLNSVDMVVRKFDFTTTDEQYAIDIDADIDLTNRNKKIRTDDEGYLDYSSFSGKGKLGTPSGAGLAMDLGVVWKPFHGFSVSASVTDMGGILWYYGNGGKSSGSYVFEGLEDLSTDEMDEETILSKIKAAGEELLAVIKPKAVNKHWKPKALPLCAGMKASYALPFFEMLSVDCSGLYTGYEFCAPYWEARGGLSLDVPGRAHLGLDAGSGNYGFVYGIHGSLEFLSFKLFATFENGVGGVIPYENTPLKANNKLFSIGLTYILKN